MGPELTRRRVLATGAAVAGTAAVLAPLSSAAAATARSAGTGAVKPTIVLVHGGYADSSCWNQTLSYLQGWGYTTICGANPLRGIPTDAPYIGSLLDSITGPVVLVAHSMGGTVITNAAAGKANVKALVYIAAFVPDIGEQLGVLINKFPGSIIQAATRGVPYPIPGGGTGTDLYLQADRFHPVFCADVPAATARLMEAAQRPFALSAFTDKTTAAAWHTVPTWGLVAGNDLAIPPALEYWFYKRARAREIIEVPGASHVAMISHPATTAGLILNAAKATG